MNNQSWPKVPDGRKLGNFLFDELKSADAAFIETLFSNIQSQNDALNDELDTQNEEVERLEADLKTQTGLAEHYRKAAVLYPGS